MVTTFFTILYYIKYKQLTSDVALVNVADSAVGPEEVYASELAQLQAMGFHDTDQNLEALTATKGNILAAVDRLRGGQ